MRSNLVLACMAALVHSASVAQDTVTRDNIDTWQPTWRFSQGDSAAWSDPLFDDSSWDATGLSHFDPGMIDSTTWGGFGWFRSQFDVDSSAAGLQVGFSAALGGAAEIFLDGELYHRLGRPSSTAGGEEPVRLSDQAPAVVVLPGLSAGPHHMAIRASNFFLSIEGETTFGPRLAFGNPAVITAQVAKVAAFHNALLYLFTGIAGALCLVYLLLFGFQPKQTGNLLFGLLAGLTAVVIFSDLHSRMVSDASDYVWWRSCMGLAGVAGWITAVGLVGSSFFKEKWKLFPVLATLAGLVAIYVFFDPIGGFWSLEVLGLLAMAELLRRVGLAVFLSRPGSGVVAFGSLLFVLGAVHDFLCHLEIINPVFGLPNLVHFGLIAFVALMAVFMAIDFARTNRSLEMKIEQLGRDANRAMQDEKFNQGRRIERIQAELENRRKEFEAEKDREIDAVRKSLVVNKELLKTTEERLIHAEQLASLGRLSSGIAQNVDDILERIERLTDSSVDLTRELDMVVQGSTKEGPSREIIAQIRKNLDRVAEQDNHARSIVDDILQHGKGSLEGAEPIHLNEVLNRYLDLSLHAARGEFPNLDLVVERSFDERAGKINVPAAHFGRAMMAVFRNAVEALAAGVEDSEDGFQPTITVSSQRLENAVLIRVRDNGSGVPQELRDRIFEPFFSTRSDRSGLGLSIAQRIIVDDLNGTFGLEHFKDQGAGFYITIPLTLGTDSDSRADKPSE